MSTLPEGFLRGFSIVVAHDEHLGIGRLEDLPWHIPEDLKRFKHITMGATEERTPVVLMGYKTWSYLPKRPLPFRVNAVVSSKRWDIPEAQAYNSLEGAIKALCSNARSGKVFVIGGGSVYAQALSHPALERLYVTEVQGDFKCDTFMAEYRHDPRFQIVSTTEWEKSSSGATFRFVEYARK